MKNFTVVALAVFLLQSTLIAQNKPSTWEEKKAAKFKPITDQARAAIAQAVPAKATVSPNQDRRILAFYRCEGFIHTSIPHGNLALQEMSRKTQAFEVELADTYDVFTPENLAHFDAILLNNTTHLKFEKPSQQNAFLDFVSGGKGLIGIHAASDNFSRHPECRALVGGQFNGHPWKAGGTWAFKLDDPAHVLNTAFAGAGFWHTDEIYQYKPESYQGPEVLRILVSLDMSKREVSGMIDDGPREVPYHGFEKRATGEFSIPTSDTAKTRFRIR